MTALIFDFPPVPPSFQTPSPPESPSLSPVANDVVNPAEDKKKLVVLDGYKKALGGLLGRLNTIQKNPELRETGNSEVMAYLFKPEFPKELRDQLLYYFWVSQGAPKTDLNWGENNLKKDVMVLLKPMKPFVDHQGSHLLEQLDGLISQQIAIEKESDRMKRATLKVNYHMHHKERFLRLLDDPTLLHHQLKRVYERLPAEVKAQVPKPPYFGHGMDIRLYKSMGAHLTENGTRFCLYAPNVKEVSVVLRKGRSEEIVIPMIKAENGEWIAFSAEAPEGTRYVYRMVWPDGGVCDKIDPFSFHIRQYHDRIPPEYKMHREVEQESVVVNIHKHVWGDQEWLANRHQIHEPLNICEVHLSSMWKKADGTFLNYREIAPKLVVFLKQQGFNSVQIMPMVEHPNDVSMGYQAGGFFAPTSRMGNVEDFQWFVDHLHQNEIQVIIDLPLAHFCKDKVYLEDGYTHSDPLRSFHSAWGTRMFNTEDPFVRRFLISCTLFWAEYCHVDGFRFDAVSTTTYHNHEREDNFKPNQKGGAEDPYGKLFYRELNFLLEKNYPRILRIAEATRPQPGLTDSPLERGLGFTHKQMVTTLVKMLRFMEAEPSQRERLFLEFVDALPPNGVKPVWLGDTHDETAKGHGSLTNKMPGNQQDKFANVRLFASFNAGQPGARSTFMTTLLAQSEEWHGRVFRSTTNPDENERKTTSMQWEELDQTVNPLNWRYHVGMGRLSSHLNELFLKHPVLSDASAESLKSIQCDSIHTVMARYRSKEGHSPVLMIQNFSGEALPNYQINLGELRNLKRVKLIFNSNDQKFFRHWLKEDDDFIAKDPHLAAPPPEFKLIGDVMIVSSLPPYSAFMIEGKL